MPKKHLNDQFIKNLASQGKRTEYYDQHLIDPETNTLKKMGVKGLALRVTKAGSKSFVYRYWYDGKSKRYKIGSYPKVKLSKARKEAKRLAFKVDEGIDPLAEKQKKKYSPGSKSFDDLVLAYKKKYLPTLRESTQKEYKRILENELKPHFKGKEVSGITEHHIRKILEDKAIKDGSPTMANRIRAVLSSLYNFAIKKVGLKIDSNPVKATSPYKSGENKRDRVYSEKEIRNLWKFFEDFDEPISSVFKMLLLTGQRKTETSRMRWKDIEMDKPYKRIEIDENGEESTEAFLVDVWTIPGEHAKNKNEHEIPLPKLALEIIEKLRPLTGDSEYVFESPRKENEPIEWLKSSVKIIKENSKVPDFRLHDLRRTAATYMAENGTSPMIIGKVLNHKGLAKENSITARYNRHDYMNKKYQALSRWNNRLKKIINKS